MFAKTCILSLGRCLAINILLYCSVQIPLSILHIVCIGRYWLTLFNFYAQPGIGICVNSFMSVTSCHICICAGLILRKLSIRSFVYLSLFPVNISRETDNLECIFKVDISWRSLVSFSLWERIWLWRFFSESKGYILGLREETWSFIKKLYNNSTKFTINGKDEVNLQMSIIHFLYYSG